MTRTTITRRVEWDMAHRIPDHLSLCKFLHGHRYSAEVTIEGPVIEEEGNPERGMVRDFGFLKTSLMKFIGYWDHGLMMYGGDPWLPTLESLDTNLIVVATIPTAEGIAAMIFDNLVDAGIPVVEVTVWETPACKATVTK